MRHPLLVALALMVPAAGRVAADAPVPEVATDAASQIKAVLAEITSGMTEGDDAKMSSAAKRAPVLYKSTTEQAIRGPLLTALGGLVKQSKFASARRSALQAIVETEDSKEAWKVLSKVYPKDDVEDTERFNCDIVKAVGDLKIDAAIDTLLTTFKKAKQAELAAEAASSLGKFHTSKQRVRVLEETCKLGKLMVPSSNKQKSASPEEQARWGAIAPSLGKAFDALTGDSVGDPNEWFKRIDDSKDLKKLFKD